MHVHWSKFITSQYSIPFLPDMQYEGQFLVSRNFNSRHEASCLYILKRFQRNHDDSKILWIVQVIFSSTFLSALLVSIENVEQEPKRIAVQLSIYFTLQSDRSSLPLIPYGKKESLWNCREHRTAVTECPPWPKSWTEFWRLRITYSSFMEILSRIVLWTTV